MRERTAAARRYVTNWRGCRRRAHFSPRRESASAPPSVGRLGCQLAHGAEDAGAQRGRVAEKGASRRLIAQPCAACRRDYARRTAAAQARYAVPLVNRTEGAEDSSRADTGLAREQALPLAAASGPIDELERRIGRPYDHGAVGGDLRVGGRRTHSACITDEAAIHDKRCRCMHVLSIPVHGPPHGGHTAATRGGYTAVTRRLHSSYTAQNTAATRLRAAVAQQLQQVG